MIIAIIRDYPGLKRGSKSENTTKNLGGIRSVASYWFAIFSFVFHSLSYYYSSNKYICYLSEV